jgi:hypothetical protein
MALRISVDLDGLRWADLYRFVDLARNGGIGPDDQVDVITYGSDPMSVSLSARIYPASDSFLSDVPEVGSGDSLRSPPLSISPSSAGSNGSTFGYDSQSDRSGSANGSHYPAFDGQPDRSSPAAGGNLPSYGSGYDSAADRTAPAPANGSHYPAFDGQPDRLPAAGGQFAGFEPVFDRSAQPKEPSGTPGPAESPYIEEFARLQEGLMRQVRRDDARPDRP